jgi:hypothetical protein
MSKPAARKQKPVKGKDPSFKRLSISIPVKLHARVKAACASGASMTRIVQELLEKRFPPES